MRDHPTVAVAGRYRLTAQGREDLESAPSCACHIHLAGLIFECADCGTVYGVLREQDAGRYARQDKPA
jgi:hypothetical protein